MNNDYYSDAGFLFSKLFATRDIPAFMKTGEIENSSSLAKLASTAFAVPSARRYPIHDPAHVYMSAAYAYAQHDTDAIPAIEKAAALFEISPAVQDLKVEIEGRLAQENQKIAAPASPNEFAIPFGDAMLRGKTDEVFGQAVELFRKQGHALSFEQKTATADAFCKEADARGLTVPDDILVYAGKFDCAADNLQIQAGLRCNHVVGAADRAKAAALVEFQNTGGGREGLWKAAQKIDQFDQEFGLTKFYGDRLQDPHHVVFNAKPKQAAAPVKIGPREYGRDRYWGKDFNQFHAMLELALGKTAADGLFQDKEPVQAKFAELSDEQAAQANRLLEAL